MSFPPVTHLALTVRDLAVSTPWYRALIGSDPVLDEVDLRWPGVSLSRGQVPWRGVSRLARDPLVVS